MIAIIDYKAGNLTSVRMAFESLDVAVTVTAAPDTILAADRVVFPGVGAIGAAMQTLAGLRLADTIRTVVTRGTPFLGICLGTQIILERSEEDGGVDGLGLVKGSVKLFQPSDRWEKVPQMGWNSVSRQQDHPAFAGIEDNSEFYFVHSYYPDPSDLETVLGRTRYGGVAFASVLGRDNLVATQFHPEKSGRVGLKFLENFVKWDPAC